MSNFVEKIHETFRSLLDFRRSFSSQRTGPANMKISQILKTGREEKLIPKTTADYDIYLHELNGSNDGSSNGEEEDPEPEEEPEEEPDEDEEEEEEEVTEDAEEHLEAARSWVKIMNKQLADDSKLSKQTKLDLLVILKFCR
jgi:hypothetical protein